MGKSHKIKLSTDLLNEEQEIVLAKFARSHLFNEDSLRSIKYYSDKKINPKQFKRKILVVENDKLKYAATNYGTDTLGHLSCSKYYVGLLNRKTNTMKIANTTMYDLQPTILGNFFGEQKEAEDKNKNDINVRDELTKAFGSLKKQRAMESRIRHQVSTENVTTVMQKAIANVNITEMSEEIAQLESLKNTTDDFLPPINRKAVKVEDVYKTSDLMVLSEDQMPELESVAAVFVNATGEDLQNWKRENTYPSFILKFLANLPLQTETRTEKCNILMLMYYLWQLLQIKAPDLKKNEFLPDMPTMIKEQLMSRFFQMSAVKSRSGPVWKTMTAQQKDCLLAYIIVLTLIINKFTFIASDLMPDIKTSQVKFNTLVRAVGAKIEKITGKHSKVDKIVLSLPLAELATKHQRNRR